MLILEDHDGFGRIAHFNGNRLRFDNMEATFGSGPIRSFSSVGINNSDFETR